MRLNDKEDVRLVCRYLITDIGTYPPVHLKFLCTYVYFKSRLSIVYLMVHLMVSYFFLEMNHPTCKKARHRAYVFRQLGSICLSVPTHSSY
jgi:hypothetical protein